MDQIVAFIGGGQMAYALASGAVEAGIFEAEDLLFAEPDSERQQFLRQKFPDAKLVADAPTAVENSRRIILAVKPQVLIELAASLKPTLSSEHLLVSIAAGISLSRLRQILGGERIIRVMPNTPCQVGAGASAIAVDESTRPADLAWVESLMGAVGRTVRLPDRLLHAATGVAGSSPAYLYLVIEALSDGGVAMGLPRQLALDLAAQSVLGAAKMVLETGLHPGQLKDQVTSPAGTTIEAIRSLEAAGIRSAFMEAVCKCAARSQELG